MVPRPCSFCCMSISACSLHTPLVGLLSSELFSPGQPQGKEWGFPKQPAGEGGPAVCFIATSHKPVCFLYRHVSQTFVRAWVKSHKMLRAHLCCTQLLPLHSPRLPHRTTMLLLTRPVRECSHLQVTNVAVTCTNKDGCAHIYITEHSHLHNDMGLAP